jgi:hypothetical protein
MAHLDACAYGMHQSVSMAAPCHTRCANASFRPFRAAQIPKGGSCHSHSKLSPQHCGRCCHDAVTAREYRTFPTQCNSITQAAQPEDSNDARGQDDMSDRRIPRRHATLMVAAAVAAALCPHAVQPAAAKSSSGDWSSPGLATVEDDAAPKCTSIAMAAHALHL